MARTFFARTRSRTGALSLLTREISLRFTYFFHSGWHGCWGVCYTYAGWFALTTLSGCLEKKVGDTTQIAKSLEKGFAYILDKQHEDGSWGENFRVRARFLRRGRLSCLLVVRGAALGGLARRSRGEHFVGPFGAHAYEAVPEGRD